MLGRREIAPWLPRDIELLQAAAEKVIKHLKDGQGSYGLYSTCCL